MALHLRLVYQKYKINTNTLPCNVLMFDDNTVIGYLIKVDVQTIGLSFPQRDLIQNKTNIKTKIIRKLV